MRYNVATKNLNLSEKILQRIENQTHKLNDRLASLSSDLPVLHIVVRKNRKHRAGRPAVATSFEYQEEVVVPIKSPKNPSPIYFDGTLKLALPKKHLVAKFRGSSLIQALGTGFKKMTKEVDVYKGKHFVSDSDYPDRSTVRDIGSII